MQIQRKGPLTLQFIAPDRSLAAHVQSYWLLCGDTHGAELTEYLHPDGGSGITLAYEGGATIDGLALHPGPIAAAVRSRPVAMTLRGRVRLLGIRFHPGGAYPLFGTAELTDRRAGLATPAALYDRIAAAPSLQACGPIIDAWLGNLIDEDRLSPLADAALRVLRARQGALRINRLAAQLGSSPRQLERLFAARFGLSAKQLSRILRVRGAKTLLARQPGHPLTEIAYRLGFADQAHFTREFKSLIGITPTAYLSHRAVDRQRASGYHGRDEESRAPGP